MNTYATDTYTYTRKPEDDVWAVYDANGKYAGEWWHSRQTAILSAKRIGGKARKIKSYLATRNQ